MKKTTPDAIGINEFPGLGKALVYYAQDKGLPLDKVKGKLGDAIIKAVVKDSKNKEGLSCNIDVKEDTIVVLHQKNVVEIISDPESDITVEDAQRFKPGVEAGAIIQVPIHVKDFGRIAAQTVKHVLRQGIKELENSGQFEALNTHKHEVVTAEVTEVDPRTGTVFAKFENFEVTMRTPDQVPGETFVPGDLFKVYVADVELHNDGGGVIAHVSRSAPELVKRMFELEVPEIYDGVVEIVEITREAGSRTKMAVMSRDPSVDPVGACIGPKGARVGKVIAMIGGEKIDIVKYSEEPAEFIAAALAPASILGVEILDAGQKQSRVTVPETQLSLAIGNKGQNARLAARLTGWKIDIVSGEAAAADAASGASDPDEPESVSDAEDEASDEASAE
ncbi:MAG: transcription termination factor NusA [Clostridia bacterium]|nr:transcription termination factor NusA [Clostridia bacterium]